MEMVKFSYSIMETVMFTYSIMEKVKSSYRILEIVKFPMSITQNCDLLLQHNYRVVLQRCRDAQTIVVLGMVQLHSVTVSQEKKL